ncbi:MAG TPA: SIS domain-containing protein [bacterium]
MSDDSFIRAALESSARTKREMIAACSESLKTASVWIADAMKAGNKLLLCGNGGSASDCQHISTEFVVRLTSKMQRAALPAIALTVNTSTLTAAANDFGFEHIFARQVEALGCAGDILIAISTSGSSPNVLEAAREARRRGLKVIAFLGLQKRELGHLADLCLCIPSEDGPRIQEGHITAGHILVSLVENRILQTSAP